MIADISKAFFEAPAKHDVCVELPEALTGMETSLEVVGKLEASLYGARGASVSWQEEVNRCMRAWGCTSGRYTPCTYLHKRRLRLYPKGAGAQLVESR